MKHLTGAYAAEYLFCFRAITVAEISKLCI